MIERTYAVVAGSDTVINDTLELTVGPISSCSCDVESNTVVTVTNPSPYVTIGSPISYSGNNITIPYSIHPNTLVSPWYPASFADSFGLQCTVTCGSTITTETLSIAVGATAPCVYSGTYSPQLTPVFSSNSTTILDPSTSEVNIHLNIPPSVNTGSGCCDNYKVWFTFSNVTPGITADVLICRFNGSILNEYCDDLTSLPFTSEGSSMLLLESNPTLWVEGQEWGIQVTNWAMFTTNVALTMHVLFCGFESTHTISLVPLVCTAPDIQFVSDGVPFPNENSVTSITSRTVGGVNIANFVDIPNYNASTIIGDSIVIAAGDYASIINNTNDHSLFTIDLDIEAILPATNLDCCTFGITSLFTPESGYSSNILEITPSFLSSPGKVIIEFSSNQVIEPIPCTIGDTECNQVKIGEVLTTIDCGGIGSPITYNLDIFVQCDVSFNTCSVVTIDDVIYSSVGNDIYATLALNWNFGSFNTDVPCYLEVTESNLTLSSTVTHLAGVGSNLPPSVTISPLQVGTTCGHLIDYTVRPVCYGCGGACNTSPIASFTNSSVLGIGQSITLPLSIIRRGIPGSTVNLYLYTPESGTCDITEIEFIPDVVITSDVTVLTNLNTSITHSHTEGLSISPITLPNTPFVVNTTSQCEGNCPTLTSYNRNICSGRLPFIFVTFVQFAGSYKLAMRMLPVPLDGNGIPYSNVFPTYMYYSTTSDCRTGPNIGSVGTHISTNVINSSAIPSYYGTLTTISANAPVQSNYTVWLDSVISNFIGANSICDSSTYCIDTLGIGDHAPIVDINTVTADPFPNQVVINLIMISTPNSDPGPVYSIQFYGFKRTGAVDSYSDYINGLTALGLPQVADTTIIPFNNFDHIVPYPSSGIWHTFAIITCPGGATMGTNLVEVNVT